MCIAEALGETSDVWAILVNEFGEVGIDGGLLETNHAEEVYIREVPGGCMCCTAGLPMLMAMNMLLARARPHRLIIEPTGLGHPSEVMNVLSSEHYRDLLDLHATVTLVDARTEANNPYQIEIEIRGSNFVSKCSYLMTSDQYQ